MDSSELVQLLDGAFERWTAMTGFDPEGRHWNNSQKQAQELQEARQLDDTGLTAFMLMKAYTERYIAEEKVSALDIVRGLSEKQAARIDLLREMLEFLERPDVDAVLELFIEDVRRAAKHYGVDHDDLQEWLESYYWLAVLRRDALLSMRKLEVHQFYHGEPGKNAHITMGSKVMEFWNIPSLVQGMLALGHHGKRAVNLCLIRDPFEALHSFWVIAVVNGESLTILTDRDPEPYPEARKANHRPDKSFVRRASRQWFPYELLDVKVTADGRELYAAHRSQLVPINSAAVALTDFSALTPPTVIWLSLLFRLVADRFLVENEALPELSYTTDMIRAPNVLLSTRPEIVPYSTYTPLKVRDITLADVSARPVRGQQDRKLSEHNEWMIRRYSAGVPETAFNIVGDKELTAFLDANGPSQAISFRGGNPRARIKTLDPLGFGSRKKVEADRIWVARYNLCAMAQREAITEYKTTYDMVRAWYSRHIETRRTWLVEHSVRGAYLDLVDTRLGRDCYAHISHYPFGALHLDPFLRDVPGQPHPCTVTRAKKTDYHATWRPKTARELALILAISFERMPWQLQQWSFHASPVRENNSPFIQNDPAERVLENPWSMDGSGAGFVTTIVVHLSRRAVNAERKRLGLPKFDWKAEHARQDTT